MTTQPKDRQQTPAQARPVSAEKANQQRQKAETQEVAGRHKNDGQKPHKGARKSDLPGNR